MGEFYNILGLMGSFVISAALVPQIIKVYRTKSATDISYGFQVLYVVGLLMIVIYGIGESLWPIYIPCSLELFGGLVLLGMKRYYDGKGAQQSTKNSEAIESGMAASPSANKYNLVLTPK